MWPAIEAALALPDSGLPRPALPGDGPPPPSRWPDRDPLAAERLVRTRAAVAAVAAEHGLPVENLLSPELLRRVTWTPPEPTEEAVQAALEAGGARPWQVRLTAASIAAALVDPEHDD
jgi:ribonuclease D